MKIETQLRPFARARIEDGVALLAVLVAILMLTTILGPFLVGMSQSGNASEYEASEREARTLVRGLRDSALQSVAESQGGADPTPGFDGRNEFPRRWRPPALPDAQGRIDEGAAPLGRTRPISVELRDVHERVFAPTMPMLLWATHFGWYGTLGADLELDDADRIQISGAPNLPDSGYIWIGTECIRYDRKGNGTLEGLTRGWSPGGAIEADTVPDPYGPPRKHRAGEMLFDARVRILATWAFDPAYGDRRGQRRHFAPFANVDEIARASSQLFGEIPVEGLEALHELLVFDAARVHSCAMGKEERVFSAIEPRITNRIVVKDPTSFSKGTVVRVRVGEHEEWALVVGAGFGSRGSSARLPAGAGTLLLDRPLDLEASEEEARVQPLLPVPVNVNTCSPEVLTLLLEGMRSRHLMSQHGVVRYPFPKSKARSVADKIWEERSYDVEFDEPRELPFTGWKDLHERVLVPMKNEGTIENEELFHLYALFMNGIEARLEYASVPISFESSGLVEYRAAAAVLSGIGETLAREERVGLAYPQPSRSVERFYTSQEIFDEATRLARSSPYWSTSPQATNVRPDRENREPPDRSLAHLMPWFHNKEARFPSTKPGDSLAMLATNRPPDLGAFCASNGFYTASHPEGLDLRSERPPTLRASVPADEPARLIAEIGKALKNGEDPVYPMVMDNGQGLGITFGWSAWWKPNSSRESVLFDLNGGEPFRSRVWLTYSSAGLELQLYDTAGQDPDPGNSSPDRTALRWFVEPGDAALETNLWFHTAIEVQAGSPGGIALFTDGALLGKPAFLTYSTGAVPELELEPRQDLSFTRLVQDASVALPLEDASTMPQRTVLRFGNELIEGTIVGNSLSPKTEDSIGGRMARGTFRAQNNSGSTPAGPPSVSGFRITTPSHPAGSSVQLYGYSSPILENTFLTPGKTRLGGALTRWSVARATKGPDDIIITDGNRSLRLGEGIDLNTKSLDLTLEAGDGGSGKVSGFDTAGGYAVLVQRHYRWLGPPTTGNEVRLEAEVGGVEIVRYSGFSGNKISITRNGLNLGRLPTSRTNSGGAAGGSVEDDITRARHFVTEWDKNIFIDVDPNEEPTMWCYLVPVSISLGGGLTLTDPVELGYSEWLQIYSASDENRCEWVRYDKLVGNGTYALRVHPDALNRLHETLVTVETQRDKEPSVRGGYEVDAGTRDLIEPPRSGWPQIGEPNSEESALDYTCRLRFRFRGDPFTGTATHDHNNAEVMPVFRTVFSPRLELGRPGRGDRVAVQTAVGSAQGAREWHTVNWSARISGHYNTGIPLGGSFGPGVSDWAGPDCNLVALRDSVGYLYKGTELKDDTRYQDRITKFPSGELPAELGQTASVGISNVDQLPFDGLVDNVQGYFGQSANVGSSGRLDQLFGVIVESVDASATTWRVAFPTRRFTLNGNGDRGGLLLVGGEVVGFTDIDRSGGMLTIANNGRGLIGTQAHAHDIGTHIHWISSRPATYLSGGMQAGSDSFLVANGRALPAGEGTVLVGRELVHYCWTRSDGSGPTLLQMPKHTSYEKNEDGEARGSVGLFRGRYGTLPGAHSDREMVISWPFRYWDRYSERADDPELGYLGFQTEAPDLFATQLFWEEEIPDSTMDLHLLVRADARVPWSADPATTPGLWRFTDPKPKTGAEYHALMAQASTWEFRFHVLYNAGAFDAETFRANAWKRTPALRNFAWSYQGETRILRERRTVR